MAKRYIGVIGDQNPIEHWGGVVYDAGYGPHVTYFQSYDAEGEMLVSVYDFPIEDDAVADLTWVDWNAVADSIGMDVGELKAHGRSRNILARASVYESVGGHYGFVELDSYPQELKLRQAERRYGRGVDAAHRAEQKKRTKRGAGRGNPGRGSSRESHESESYTPVPMPEVTESQSRTSSPKRRISVRSKLRED